MAEEVRMKGLSVGIVVCMIWMMALQDVAIVLAGEAPFPGAALKIPIAVMELRPRGLSAEEAGVLSDRFRVELMLTERFDVMTREEMMNRILEEQKFHLTGFCDDEVCLVEIGRLIGVRKMVAGSVGKVGRLYSVSVWMVDVETGQMSQPCKGDHLGEVEGLQTEVIPRLARQLAGLPVVPPRPFYKAWWFWTVVGGMAAGSVVAAMQTKGGEEAPTTGIIKVDVPWPK